MIVYRCSYYSKTVGFLRLQIFNQTFKLYSVSKLHRDNNIKLIKGIKENVPKNKENIFNYYISQSFE